MNELSVPGWCPAEDSEQWLWDQYQNDDRYIPVIWDSENPDTAPRYVDDDSDDEGSGGELDVQVNEKEADGKKKGCENADEHIPVTQVA
jgi:hypothetical protein